MAQDYKDPDKDEDIGEFGLMSYPNILSGILVYNGWYKTNVTDGTNIQPTGECCVNGILGYDSTYCPGTCTTCALGNELAGLTFDSTTMLVKNQCQCVCNEEAGYHVHKLSDGTYKCLPYCTKDTGIFLLVDRSGSTFSKKGSDYKCDHDKDPCTKINTLLKGLKLSDRNYAIYNEETGGCGYNVAMSTLTFGHHTNTSYNLWNSVQYKVKCSDSSGTYFDKALAHIYGHYCTKDQPIIIMIITDGEIQKRKDDMSSYMNSMINKCNATIIYVGPDSSALKKNMNKNVTNFYAYGFDSSVQTWIDKGVDFVTCDWHEMDKLKLPVAPDESTIVKHTVKFYDKDNNLFSPGPKCGTLDFLAMDRFIEKTENNLKLTTYNLYKRSIDKNQLKKNMDMINY